jgi:hypothetical protein
MVGVWIDPVTAQVMMTLSALAMRPSSLSCRFAKPMAQADSRSSGFRLSTTSSNAVAKVS